jgi:hypothetical protein
MHADESWYLTHSVPWEEFVPPAVMLRNTPSPRFIYKLLSVLRINVISTRTEFTDSTTKGSQIFTTLQFNILYPITDKTSCARVTRFQIGYHKPLHVSSKYLQKKMKTKSWNHLSPIFSLYFHWGCRIISCDMSNLLRNSKNFSFRLIRVLPLRFFHWDLVEHIGIFRAVFRMGIVEASPGSRFQEEAK